MQRPNLAIHWRRAARTFSSKKTPELTPFKAALDDLINTEKEILDHLQLFLNALIHHDVFTTPVPPNTTQKVAEHGLLDFLSPYSNMEIARTANKNYRISTGIKKAHNAELKLSHRQNKLASTYQNLDSAN